MISHELTIQIINLYIYIYWLSYYGLQTMYHHIYIHICIHIYILYTWDRPDKTRGTAISLGELLGQIHVLPAQQADAEAL